MAMILIASFPAIQRDLFLSRMIRRDADAPLTVETLSVRWSDMVVVFATDAAISECTVEVAEEISLVTFTGRLEILLDCGGKPTGEDWVLKFSAKISTYGDPTQVRRLLCDKIASLDGVTGETIGVMKIKRRSVEKGHAKVRLVPAEDSLQLVVRHQSAQGLKAVWKSCLWRLSPQFGGHSQEDGLVKFERWAVQVHNYGLESFQWEVFETGVRLDFYVPQSDSWSFISFQDNFGSNGKPGQGLDALKDQLIGRRTKLVMDKSSRKLLLVF